MLFERFEDKGLAQYSYAVGCERAGPTESFERSRIVSAKSLHLSEQEKGLGIVRPKCKSAERELFGSGKIRACARLTRIAQ